MHYYEPDTYYQQRARRLGAGDGCYSPDGIQVYTISETAYAELCRNIWSDGFVLDCAPKGEYVVVCGRMWFGGKHYVRPINAFTRLLYAVEDAAGMCDYARRAIRHNIGVEYEIWHIVPDYLLSAVYAVSSPEPERPESDTVAPVVIATDCEAGQQLIITPDEPFVNVTDAVDVAMLAVNYGFDNVGIVWMRPDWATSQTLATAYLYKLGYSLCHGDIAAKLGVVTNGRD